MGGKTHLKDEGVARQERHQCFRDLKTGRYISNKNLENYGQIEKREGETEKPKPVPISPLGEKIIEAVREQGIEVNTIEEVWAKLIGIQAEIALDKTNGSKATAAAKLVAQVMGTMEGDTNKGEGTDVLVLGRDLAKEVLALIDQEKDEREKEMV